MRILSHFIGAGIISLIAFGSTAHGQEESNDPIEPSVYVVIDGMTYRAPRGALKAIRTAGELVLEVNDPSLSLSYDPPRYLVLTRVQK